MKFYDGVIDEMVKLGIEPVMTMLHYEIQLHLSTEYRGWTNKKCVNFYMNLFKVLFDRYRLPISIAENGLGAIDEVKENGIHGIHDDYRINYLREHVLEIKESIKDGVNVMVISMWT